MSKINFLAADCKVDLKNRRKVKDDLLNIFQQEQFKLLELNYVFCSDEYLLKINRKHLNHDYFTDIITFRLSNELAPIEGEVYLSVDRIKENSKVYSVAYQIELLRVLVHGALHLCGYDDQDAKQKKIMKLTEDYYVQKFSRET